MVEFSLPQIGLELGGGAVIGGLIGFTAKKVAKIIALIIGLELALFKFLETRGILNVNWDAIGGAAENATSVAGEGGAEANSYLMSLLATLPIGAGFTGGFLLAFKKA